MQNSVESLKAVRRTGTPIVCIRTADSWSALDKITTALGTRADTTPVMLWDIMRGLVGVNPLGRSTVTDLLTDGDPMEVSGRPTDMLLLAAKMKVDGAIILMMNANRYWTDPAVAQGIWNLREPYKTKKRTLVMTATRGAVLPPELQNDVHVIDEALPSPVELEAILDNIVKGARIEITPETRTRAIDAVAGLAAFPAEQAMAMSIDPAIRTLDVNGLWDRKRQIIEQTPGLTVHRGEVPEPVGIENIRSFLKRVLAGKKRYRSILFIDEIEKAFAGTGTDTSGVKTGMTGTFCTWVTESGADGILMVGVPGGGKTLVAKWAGGHAGVPTIAMDFGGMQSGIIGSTEERLRGGFSTVDAISQGNSLIIGTCNGIGQMPPEVLRRFNLGTFFFDLMGEAERTACWKHYRAKHNIDSEDNSPAADGWTGAEISECCKLAEQLSVPLIEAAAFIVPVSRSNADRIRALRISASGKYISASTPGIYKWKDAEAEDDLRGGGGVRSFDDGPAAVSKRGRA